MDPVIRWTTRVERETLRRSLLGAGGGGGDDELVVTRVSPSHYLNQDLGTVWPDK